MLGCMPLVHFKPLIEGESVTLDDGSTVTPEMVMGKGKQGQGFMSVFLPDPAYIPSFLRHNADVIDHLAGLTPESENQMQLIYHSMPQNCLVDELY